MSSLASSLVGDGISFASLTAERGTDSDVPSCVGTTTAISTGDSVVGSWVTIVARGDRAGGADEDSAGSPSYAAEG